MTEATPLYQLHKSILLLITTIAVLCGLLSAPVMARSLYKLTATSEGITRSKGFDNIDDFINQLNNNGLQALIPPYQDPTSAANVTLDLRGLPATATYPANSTALNFQVPCSGTNETFQGATRDESQQMLRRFLEGRGGGELTNILQCLVSKSPVDPVAGNPNSLLATMASSDYQIGTTMDAGKENLLGIGLNVAHSEASGFGTTWVSLPLNYVITVPNPSKPPYAFIFDLPIRYLNVEGGNVIDGSFAFGVRVPILRRWAVTPMLRAGIVGSVDAGAAQIAYSGTVTSQADFYFQDLRLSVNNMVGYYTTDSVSIGKFHVDYNVDNGIFRNGLALEGSLNYKLFDDPTSWEVQFVDTRVAGDSWFNNWYDEIVATVGTRRRATRMTWQELRIGASYTFGDKFNRFQFLLNYRF
jgi:hypothetical protein